MAVASVFRQQSLPFSSLFAMSHAARRSARGLHRAVSRFSTSALCARRIAHETHLRGQAVLEEPALNKGTAFTREEREALDLEGCLPYEVASMDTQIRRVRHQIDQRHDDLSKHTFLMSLRQQNTTLFYATLYRYLKELLSIVYTPTVGEAIQQYSSLFRRSQGLFLSYPNRQRMRRDIASRGTKEDVDLVIVTDGEGILGLGDQGVGGVDICLGKAAIYTIGSGVDPARVLPVVLDVGTDNEALLNDELYTGWKSKRIRGEEYDAFLDDFVHGIAEQFPDALLHFEDFGLRNAQRLLSKYRGKYSVFNDDIQGTGATATTALLSATKINGTELKDQRIVIYGAGSAGMGITDAISRAMVALGTSPEDAAKNFWLVDRYGLIATSTKDKRPGQERYARSDAEEGLSLVETIKRSKATVLVGTSGQGGAFNEEVVRAMVQNTEQPIILPLSNPTRLCEGRPQDIHDWSDGKALMATGSPFADITTKDGKKREIAQCNNAVIYPGLGLGTILAKAKQLSDLAIAAGANALAELSPALHNPNKGLLPPIEEVRHMSVKVAAAVMRAAKEEGSAVAEVKDSQEEIESQVKKAMWLPVYHTLRPAKAAEP